MNYDASSQSNGLPADLKAIAYHVRSAAQHRQGDSLELLALLRLLEALHREIRESFFQPTLPDNRQALYALLRDIEVNGGWPYINRMKLRTFMEQLNQESSFMYSEPEVTAGTEQEDGNSTSLNDRSQ